MEGPHLKKCPRCGGRLERLMSAPAIQFKGSGWYVTDYARSSNRDAEKSDGGSASDKSESKTESKTETKADAKTETKTASETKEKKKVANDK
jgi:predicted nucleic acid-binding Zn ribbon protein